MIRRAILISISLCAYGAVLVDEHVDFIDETSLSQQERRVERSPDYGGGVGGPLAAMGVPQPGKKPNIPNVPKEDPRPAAKPNSQPQPKDQPKPKSQPEPKSQPKSQPQPKAQEPKSQPKPQPDQKSQPSQGKTKPDESPKPDSGSEGPSGEDVVNQIYEHPEQCGDPDDGGIWAPLPKGQPCGKEGRCSFPQKWCSAKTEKSSTTPHLACRALSEKCQNALKGGPSETTGGTPAPEVVVEPPPTEAATTAVVTTVATTAATTQATTKATTRATTVRTTAATTQATTVAAVTGGSSNCADANPFCCFWANNQQCDANSLWMKANCQRSCGTCGCTGGSSACPTKVNTAGCQWGGGSQGGASQSMTRIILSGGAPGTRPSGTGSQSFGSGGGSSVATLPLSGRAFAGSSQGTATGQGGGPPAPAPGMVRIVFG